MANDLTDFSTVDGDDLTVDQIRGIILQIDLNVYNLLRDGKRGGFNYKVADRTVTKDAYLKELRELRAMYARLLTGVPAIEVTVYDDPAI